MLELAQPALIPCPAHIEVAGDEFIFTADTVILADEPHLPAARYLRDLLSQRCGGAERSPAMLSTGAALPQGAAVIRLVRDDGVMGEGYSLTITPRTIEILAATPAGGFYGVQTLRQLLPPTVERPDATADPLRVPCLTIRDAPRFPWRGFMLDEARHFQGKASVLRLLDLMALLKLNVFHWHLTDDQGWRIEIKRYARLTEIGGQRAAAPLGQPFALGPAHAGYYTQAETREIVAYAAARHVTVVPEIEMPGHAQAALAAYPELGCTGHPVAVCTRAGIIEEVFCAGREGTYTFLQNVLEEVLNLFPGPWIHTGGDEVPKARWRACPHCQARILSAGLRNEDGLQTYFTDRIAAWLEERGRRPVAWAGGMHSVPPARGVAQFWLAAPAMLREYLETSRKAVASGHPAAYLDMKYVIAPLNLSYEYEPLPAETDAAYATGLLGVEAPLWTEWVKDRNRLDYQTFPRLLAFAEKGWTSCPGDYAAFRARVRAFLPRLDALGVQYALERDWDPPQAAQWLAKVALRVLWARLDREAAKNAA